MACEWKFGVRHEDADFDFGGIGVGGLIEENGLGEVEFAGYGKILVVCEGAAGGDVYDCEWVALEAGVGEDIEGCVF